MPLRTARSIRRANTSLSWLIWLKTMAGIVTENYTRGRLRCVNRTQRIHRKKQRGCFRCHIVHCNILCIWWCQDPKCPLIILLSYYNKNAVKKSDWLETITATAGRWCFEVNTQGCMAVERWKGQALTACVSLCRSSGHECSLKQHTAVITDSSSSWSSSSSSTRLHGVKQSKM